MPTKKTTRKTKAKTKRRVPAKAKPENSELVAPNISPNWPRVDQSGKKINKVSQAQSHSVMMIIDSQNNGCNVVFCDDVFFKI